MSPRTQKVSNVSTQTIADRVKSNPRVAAKHANEVLMANTVEETERSTVTKPVAKTVYHRYMLRSMRR